MKASSKTPAFLFDLDGTLVDSVYQHVLAWREAHKRCDIELAVWRIHRRIYQDPLDLLQHLGEVGVRVAA